MLPLVLLTSLVDANTADHPVSLNLKVLAHTRPDSLSRLLEGLASADYEEGTNVNLDIYVDAPRSDEEEPVVASVRALSRSFPWRWGAKSVVMRNVWHGLRRQWLEAWPEPVDGEYVLILEDDLEVSPAYYHYALEVLKNTSTRGDLAGVSL